MRFRRRLVQMTRPILPPDRERYRMFFESFGDVEGPIDGGVSVFVSPRQARQYERAGWQRVPDR